MERLRLSAEIFEDLRRGWVSQPGEDRVHSIEDDLTTVFSRGSGGRIGSLPGWLRQSGVARA
jgi:hypothetical protein